MTFLLGADNLEAVNEQAFVAPSRLHLWSLLKSVGLEPQQVKLHRHRAEFKSKGIKATPYTVWFSDKTQNTDSFKTFQSLQNKPHTMNREYIAAFVETPSKETLFVGIYKQVSSPEPLINGIECPVNKVIGDGTLLYNLEKTSHLSELEGRLVIRWSPKDPINWARNAEAQPDLVGDILEIKPSIAEQVFPGFHDFVWPIQQLDRMPTSWKEKLRTMQGVYLLVCQDEGQQYVGSASGDEGFYSRWESYFKSGHGGNIGMKAHQTSGYQVSILEIASSSDTQDDVLKKEASWKEKLMTRFFGLNKN